MNNLAIIWTAIVAVPLIMGFLFSKIKWPRLRGAMFWMLVLAPIWLWTFAEIISPPSYPAGHFDRWSFGMALLIPVVVAWASVAVIAFRVGRRSVG